MAAVARPANALGGERAEGEAKGAVGERVGGSARAVIGSRARDGLQTWAVPLGRRDEEGDQDDLSPWHASISELPFPCLQYKPSPRPGVRQPFVRPPSFFAFISYRGRVESRLPLFHSSFFGVRFLSRPSSVVLPLTSPRTQITSFDRGR